MNSQRCTMLLKEYMNRGILLIAFGKPYGKMAFNLAASIKVRSGIKIHLVCDADALSDISTNFFDSHQVYDFKTLNNRIDPCQAKIDIYSLSPFQKTLFLDVDAVCMNSLEGLFDKLSGTSVYFQVMGRGRREDKITYSHWAENKTIWEHFKLKDDAILSSCQTSVIYFEKGKEGKKFFDQLQNNYNNRLDKNQYSVMWGMSKAHPDELYYSVTATQLNILPDIAIQPLFYPNILKNEGEIMKEFPVLSIYGAHRTIKNYGLDLYDRIMKEVMKKLGMYHKYQAHNLYKLKFAGQR